MSTAFFDQLNIFTSHLKPEIEVIKVIKSVCFIANIFLFEITA